jgi:hypothetical protein
MNNPIWRLVGGALRSQDADSIREAFSFPGVYLPTGTFADDEAAENRDRAASQSLNEPFGEVTTQLLAAGRKAALADTVGTYERLERAFTAMMGAVRSDTASWITPAIHDLARVLRKSAAAADNELANRGVPPKTLAAAGERFQRAFATLMRSNKIGALYIVNQLMQVIYLY